MPGRATQSILSRAHSIPATQRMSALVDFSYSLTETVVESTVLDAEKSISQQVQTISKLADVASKYPYYKYNSMWTRDVQNAVCTPADGGEEISDLNRHSRLCFVDGSVVSEESQGRHSQDGFSTLRKLDRSCKVCFRTMMLFTLLSLVLNTVPVNLKERDAFHLTIEEYLQSLISLIEELVGPKSFTLGE